MDRWSRPGGILAVVELINNHRPAFTYDFRSRFSLSPDDIGEKVSWADAVYLVAVLLRDPSSWLQTSVNKWSHPVSYEWAVHAATYDMLAQVNSKRKPKPFPRPWPDANKNRKGTARKDGREILARARQGEFKWQNKPTRTSR